MTRAAFRSSQAGVSLVETLAALAIIALVTGVAVVMLRPEDAPEQVEGEALVRALNEARQDALVTGRHVGFGARPDGRGYQFFQFEGDLWRVRTDHPAFDAHRFEDPDLVLTVQSGAIARREAIASAATGTPQRATPEVWFDPAGIDLPFAYDLRGADGMRRISRDGQGRLSLSNPLTLETGS